MEQCESFAVSPRCSDGAIGPAHREKRKPARFMLDMVFQGVSKEMEGVPNEVGPPDGHLKQVP